MKLEKVLSWLDKTLKVADFDDVSNNGLQVDRAIKQSNNQTISMVAFAVDASVRAVEQAAKAGAQLLVVHHGISWGGGIKRLTGGVANVVRAAQRANLAIAAYHLPLDAHPTLGNNAQLAKLLGLRRVKPAFNYHGNVIGLVGELARRQAAAIGSRRYEFGPGRIGVCSGGAGEFAEEAKRLACDLYVTGEASWGDVISAENCGMEMICAGHYETEVFGVRALSKAMKKALKLRTIDLTK
ncbi:MAG: Nif3-like dinuclear metal center hexameric protein [bacterium]|nr:Nif3-like dinuclear metal center hexameric protein [Candidatus Colisoma equi]